jgi:hypothetical protein
MPSKRTIITLSDVERRWLANYTKSHGVSMAEAVRRGIACLKTSQSSDSYRTLVQRTRGVWSKGDGLSYQERLRSEWGA